MTRCSLLIQKVNCIPVRNGGAAWQSGDGSAERLTLKWGYLQRGRSSKSIKPLKIASVFVLGLNGVRLDNRPAIFSPVWFNGDRANSYKLSP